ncbi:NAD-dependent epimerase/dehydratase family protein [Vallicoccus soli]|uniref:NAD-dependent epimerase/dehydratase family protein n=1 Tax=Vallicoccus soli TaxID=2339232 RepID=A0A3A3Z0F2_9ACTN|nr:NAD-dependent epimerase/dehydratase family protein [Vallicoccus soli]RJK97729.1 NAD-dependent epimerase/dehydratase family protein [Vallicoccus soli]
MRVVVTGASGNLGTALLRRLVDGHDVVGVARRPPRGGEPYEGATWHALDLGDASAASRLREVVEGADAVVHLAWLFQPSHDTAYLERVGVGGSRAVVQAVRRAGVPHLVHLSSLGAYSPGPDDRRVDEAWPTGGVSSLAYSRHKVAVERLLDEVERDEADRPDDERLRIARMRPGIVLQGAAGSALLRYGLPAWVPSSVVRHVPVLPLDRSLVFQAVHTDDVADALVRVLERRAEGAFNLVADPPVTRDLIAEVLGARAVHVPYPVVRAAAAAAWQARLQPLDPGWIDLAFAVPLLEAARAREVLGWEPATDARSALAEAVAAMGAGAGTTSPVLRPRRVLDELARAVRSAPKATRKET